MLKTFFKFITGDATLDANLEAAWIYGACDLIVGILLLIAGRWAYNAARKETRYMQYADKRREISYTHNMLSIVYNLLRNIEYNIKIFKRMLDEKQPLNANEKLKLINLEEFNPKYWENHALLFKKEIGLIYDFWVESNFYKEVEEKFFNSTKYLKYLTSQDLTRSEILENLKAYYEYTKFQHRISFELEKSLEKSLVQKQRELALLEKKLGIYS